jgi:hypothetical protein
VALIVGAGCSCEPPTNLPLSRACALEVHSRLVNDGILQAGDCPQPEDLAAVADAVLARHRPQREVVIRMPTQAFQTARPNDGYRHVCALLSEHAIKFVVTLNYDLAIVTALYDVQSRHEICIVLGPQSHDQLGMVNIIFLHGSAHETNPDNWIIRTDQLAKAWRDAWQEVMINHVVASPAVVFAGLGTLVPSVSEITRRISACLNAGHQKYQVDTSSYERSALAQSISIKRENFIQLGWCEFMQQLSTRVAIDQMEALQREYAEFVAENGLAEVNAAAGLFASLRGKDLMELGHIRGYWLMQTSGYLKRDLMQQRHLADLLHGIAVVSEELSCACHFYGDGNCLLEKDGTVLCVLVPVSGLGHRRFAALERTLARLERSAKERAISRPVICLLAGVQGDRRSITAPEDITVDLEADDIVQGTSLPPYHVDVEEIRLNPEALREVLGLA